MRAPIIGLLSVQIVGLLLLLTPFAFRPSIDRVLWYVVTFGGAVCVCWASFWLAPNHPRIAVGLLRVALAFSVLEACNAVLAF
jgi:hypothetical protein